MIFIFPELCPRPAREEGFHLIALLFQFVAFLGCARLISP